MNPRRPTNRRRALWQWAAAALCSMLCVRCIWTGHLPAPEMLAEARQPGPAPAGGVDRQPAPLSPDCRLLWLLTEEETSTLNLQEGCKSEPGLRWFPRGGPRGIVWDTARGLASYRPDWLEGGDAKTPREVALEGWRDGRLVRRAAVELRVDDALAPAQPVCVETTGTDALRRFACTLTTDSFLDGPTRVGRVVRSLVTVPRKPSEPASLPVRLWLHGLGGSPNSTSAGCVGIAPHDPDTTYWWGYGEPDAGITLITKVPDYTLRQSLVIVAWALAHFAEADPNRLSVQGSSMGGAGALQASTHYARHIAWADAALGQHIPRNHRPARLRTLSKLYGPPGAVALAADESSIWDELDVTRQFLLHPESREPFVTTRHGKDDTTINFGAALQPSPATGLSFYGALAALHIGHTAVWDEGGHGVSDPRLPSRWWGPAWELTTDGTSRVALNLAHVAFTNATHDPDPGSMVSRDGAVWDPEAGFAGNVKVAGDTHWAGAFAGVINRGLRWKSDEIVDAVEAFSVPLRLLDGDGGASPAAGYPCTGKRLCAELPVRVDVTLRRTQAFRFAPDEPFVWRSGQQSGEGRANALGEVTVAGVEVTPQWRTMLFRRVWPHEDAAALLKDGWEQ